jgi:hypothetical protein
MTSAAGRRTEKDWASSMEGVRGDIVGSNLHLFRLIIKLIIYVKRT